MAELRSKYGFFLMVDEAHAVGALGPGGRGLCARGAGYGGHRPGNIRQIAWAVRFVPAAPQGVCRLFRKPFLRRVMLHSHASGPCCGVLKLLERLPLLDAERARLRDNAVFFRTRLCELGIPTRGTAHIVAVPTGGEARTTHLGEQLAERGVLALGGPLSYGSLRRRFAAVWAHRLAYAGHVGADGPPPCGSVGVSIRRRWLFQYPFHKKMNGYYSIMMLA